MWRLAATTPGGERRRQPAAGRSTTRINDITGARLRQKRVDARPDYTFIDTAGLPPGRHLGLLSDSGRGGFKGLLHRLAAATPPAATSTGCRPGNRYVMPTEGRDAIGRARRQGPGRAVVGICRTAEGSTTRTDFDPLLYPRSGSASAPAGGPDPAGSKATRADLAARASSTGRAITVTCATAGRLLKGIAGGLQMLRRAPARSLGLKARQQRFGLFCW